MFFTKEEKIERTALNTIKYRIEKALIAFAFVFLLLGSQAAISPGFASQMVWTRTGFGETLQIDSQGYLFLNGKQVIAVGFHLKHGVPNPSQTVAESMLQRLSSDGVRFMTLNFAHWETDQNVQTDINFWMPLLLKYKMWTFLQVQVVYADPSPPVLTVQAQLPRQQLVINTISANSQWANIIYAYSVAWEFDNGPFGFTDATVSAYLQQITPQVRTALSNSGIGQVPIVNKPQGPWNDNRGRVPMGLYADLIGIDYYATITSSGSNTFTSYVTNEESILQTQYRSECNKPGFAVWHTEFGISDYGLNNEMTPTLFNQLLNEYGYGDCGSVMFWIMWSSTANNYSAFNVDGTPKQWYTSISNILKTLIPETPTTYNIPNPPNNTTPNPPSIPPGDNSSQNDQIYLIPTNPSVIPELGENQTSPSTSIPIFGLILIVTILIIVTRKNKKGKT